jgi:hypothetical protein
MSPRAADMRIMSAAPYCKCYRAGIPSRSAVTIRSVLWFFKKNMRKGGVPFQRVN